MTQYCHIPDLAFYTLGAAYYAVQLYLIWHKGRDKSNLITPGSAVPVQS